ncbi:hypothetical protein pqer_cds_92 [Pandoravirus quercus]|uniref:Uncharacterized protein n=1 Tax=Pandoravirus quercus TaxID=2107709 RepID=A0A2U7U7W5_9VIRU|nr:hypothetical protein pqer_cds_92 [Pandoravirus quercus]AVK74514.1 hypothetical protein pqer_cds_92 [Pandoravirus quercus]
MTATGGTLHQYVPTGRFPYVPLDPAPRPWAAITCAAACALVFVYGVWSLVTGANWVESVSAMLLGVLGALAIRAKHQSGRATVVWSILARLLVVLPRSTPLLFDLNVAVATFLAGHGRSGDGGNTLDLFIAIDHDDGKRHAAVYCRQQVERLWPALFAGHGGGGAFAEVPPAVFEARGIPPFPVRVFACHRPPGTAPGIGALRDRHPGRPLAIPLSALFSWS